MRYPDCIREDGNCELCAQSSRWKDCKGNPAGELAYRRSVNNLTQQQVADAAGIHLTAYQRLEYGGRLIRKRLWMDRAALLFGSEKFGLGNEDMAHCHWLMRIPTRDEHASMNLGQAVAVCLYELARSTVAVLASSTLVFEAPVAGLNTGCARPCSWTMRPSIRWPTVAVTFASCFMAISHS